LAGKPQTHSVVLADPMGLLIEGNGKEIEEVAAVTAHITDVALKTMPLLPFGAVQRISIEDENHLTITIYPVTSLVSGKFILSTFSTGPGPDPQTFLSAINEESNVPAKEGTPL
jgi:hypothetical protein